jgi:hypothetical protein
MILLWWWAIFSHLHQRLDPLAKHGVRVQVHYRGQDGSNFLLQYTYFGSEARHRAGCFRP